MDITLTLNDRDFSDRVSNYSVTHEPISQKIVTTMDFVEHVPLFGFRVVIRFALIPASDDTVADDYGTLSDGVFTAVYTDPHAGSDRTQTVRLASDLSAVFGIKSVDGNRYYKGKEIVLRAIAPGLGADPEESVADDSDESGL